MLDKMALGGIGEHGRNVGKVVAAEPEQVLVGMTPKAYRDRNYMNNWNVNRDPLPAQAE